jgi:hypothetical protein
MNTQPDRDRFEKLSLLCELIKLARVDQDLKQIEHDFLLIISRQLGIADEDFEAMFEEYISFTPPRLEADRILQFQRLILLMHVDNYADTTQLNMIRDLGIRMGLMPTATDEVLRIMNDYPNKIVPVERLIQIFQVHHN